MKATLRALTTGLVLLLAAGPASAALFTVTLSNGTSFETRYRPVQAEWDDNQVMIMTDAGNWIALQKAEIVDVESQAEITGYGYQVDTTTLYLGWSPNDVVDDGEDDGEGGTKPPEGGQEEERPIEYGDEAESSGFSFEQFLDVPEEGQPLGGGFSLDSGIDN